jgi:hypothetical protein
MKKLVYIIISLVIGILLITCENEPDLREPELQDAVAPYMKLTDNSSLYVDLLNLGSFNYEAVVDILFEDPFQKLTVVVVFNGDFENQHTMTDNITSVPQTVSYSLNDVIAAVPGLNAASDLVEGDYFNFFVNATMEDESVLAGYTDNGDLAYSSSMVNTLAGLKNGATFDISIPVPCPATIDDWPGMYDCFDLNYASENTTAEIFLDVGVTNGLKIYGMYSNYAEPDTFRIVLNPANFTVSFPEQTISQDLWGYGPATAAAGGGTYNTCELSIRLDLNVCVSLGCFSTFNVYLVKQ